VIVVDADVIAYAWIRGHPARSELADAVRKRDASWAVPPVWISEFRNILVSYMRFREMGLDQARRLTLIAEADLGPNLISLASGDVLSLAAESGCTAYDCEYVAAARSIGVTLVTGDRKLAAAFPGTALTMQEFVGAG